MGVSFLFGGSSSCFLFLILILLLLSLLAVIIPDLLHLPIHARHQGLIDIRFHFEILLLDVLRGGGDA